MPKPVKVSFAISGAKELDNTLESIEKRIIKLAAAETKWAKATVAAAKAQNSAARMRSASPAASQHFSGVPARSSSSQSFGPGGPYRTAGTAGRSYMEVEREAQAHASRMYRIKERSALMAGRIAQKRANDEVSAAKLHGRMLFKVERDVELEEKKSAAARRAGVINAFGGAARSTVGDIAGVAGGLGLSIGTAGITNALMSNVRLKYQAQQIENASTNKEGKLAKTTSGRTVNASFLTDFAKRMSTAHGVDASSVLAGLGTVSERAGGGEAMASVIDSWDDMTKTAVAYGTTMEDLGGVVAAALDAGVSPGQELQKLMQDFIAMGKIGSIEFSDLASELAKLKGAGLSYDVGGSDMLRSMVALTQVGARAAVSPEASRTSLRDISNDLTMKQKLLTASGIQTHNNGKLRSPFELLADIIEKSETQGLYTERGDVKRGKRTVGRGGLDAIFTGTSKNIMGELNEIFRGKDAAKYGKGRDAVLKALKEFSGASLPEGERDKAYNKVMATEVQQVRVAFQKFNAEIGKITPQLVKLLPTLSVVSEKFAQLAVWVAKNPFEGLGLLFAGYLQKELMAAGLKKILETSFGGMAGLTIGIATATLLVKNLIDERLDSFEEAQRNLNIDKGRAEQIANDPNATIEEKRAALETLKKSKAEAASRGVDPITGVLGSLGAGVVDASKSPLLSAAAGAAGAAIGTVPGLSTLANVAGGVSSLGNRVLGSLGAGDGAELNPEVRAAKSDVESGKLIASLEAQIAASDALAKSKAAETAAIERNKSAIDGATQKILELGNAARSSVPSGRK